MRTRPGDDLDENPAFRNKWFDWLLAQAPSFDLIAIAGDLLDMFSSVPRLQQSRDVSRWLQELSKITRVAVCSGNHDTVGRQIARDRAPVYEWFAQLGDVARIVSDGSTYLLTKLS
jgi:predicted MPP superfamily phosphohydrolase